MGVMQNSKRWHQKCARGKKETTDDECIAFRDGQKPRKIIKKKKNEKAAYASKTCIWGDGGRLRDEKVNNKIVCVLMRPENNDTKKPKGNDFCAFSSGVASAAFVNASARVQFATGLNVGRIKTSSCLSVNGKKCFSLLK